MKLSSSQALCLHIDKVAYGHLLMMGGMWQSAYWKWEDEDETNCCTETAAKHSLKTTPSLADLYQISIFPDRCLYVSADSVYVFS